MKPDFSHTRVIVLSLLYGFVIAAPIYNITKDINWAIVAFNVVMYTGFIIDSIQDKRNQG